jgi:hypothetical protein
MECYEKGDRVQPGYLLLAKYGSARGELLIVMIFGQGTDSQGTDLKWSEIRKNQGTKTFLGLQPNEAALYSRAQFTPDEVSSLRTQFEHMDFVSHSLRINVSS